TAEQDLSLGLQPEHGTYRDNKDTNVHELLGAEFGGHKISGSTNMVMGENGEEHIELGRQEIIRIPESCPSCNFPGESLTALTDIPHFKEVIIMAFTCSQCGYKNSEVKGGGAVPSMGTQVTLRATSMEDLKRDVLKSDSAMVRIEELDMELSYGTLGGIYSTVEGLLTKIEENLRDSNPFMLGDSSTLHHSEELLKDKPKDKFTEVLDHLRLLYL
ncbi:zpr1, partial [Symbiodinium microadriaticum]